MPIKYRPKISLEVRPLEFTMTGPAITVDNGGKAAKLMQEYAAKYNLCYGIFCDDKLLMWSFGGIPLPENLPSGVKNEVHYAKNNSGN